MESTLLHTEELIRLLRAENPGLLGYSPKELLATLESVVAEVRHDLEAGKVDEIRGELRDSLFGLVSLTEWFREQKLFSLADLDKELCANLSVRYPYISAHTQEQQTENWTESDPARIADRHRIGISILCEIYDVAGVKLSNIGWLRDVLLRLRKVVGLPPLVPGNLVTFNPQLRVTGYPMGIVCPPNFLFLQAFSRQGLVLFQGFSNGKIDRVELYNYLSESFGSDKIDLLLIDRGYRPFSA